MMALMKNDASAFSAYSVIAICLSISLSSMDPIFEVSSMNSLQNIFLNLPILGQIIQDLGTGKVRFFANCITFTPFYITVEFNEPVLKITVYSRV